MYLGLRYARRELIVACILNAKLDLRLKKKQFGVFSKLFEIICCHQKNVSHTISIGKIL